MADKKTLSVIIKAVDALSPTLKVINSRLRTLKTSIATVGRAGDTIAGKLGVPLSLFGISALGGLGGTVTGFANKAEELSNAVKKIGGSAADLQVFRKAAEMANIPTEVLDAGLTRLNRNIAEGAAGKNKDFAAMLQHLRIPLRKANGELRTAGELLPELADAFEKNTNAAVRGRIASTTFGAKMGSGLIPMLTEGSKGLNDVRSKLVGLGAIMGDKAIADGANLEGSMKTLQIASRGLGNTIGAVLAPALTPLLESLTAWIAANREIIASKVQETVGKWAAQLRAFDWAGFGATLNRIGEAIGWFVDKVGGWGNALTALAIILNASIIASLIEIGIAAYKVIPAIYGIGRALVLLAVANPVMTAIVVAIAAIAYGGYLIYKNWGPISQWFTDKWAAIKNVFVLAIADLLDMLQPITDILDKVFGSNINASIKAAIGYTNTGQLATAPSLASAGAGSQRINGKLDININGAPPGTRVSEVYGNTGSIMFNSDVGYSSAALGLP
jgi:hypothetical protein